MQNSKPFSRSFALISAINAAFISFGSDKLGLQQHVTRLSASKEFQSRGHGRGKRSGVNVKALAKMRRHLNSNSYAVASYVPYGGKKEIARRNDLPTATPRRLWHAVDEWGFSLNRSFATRRAAVAVGGFAELQ